MSSTIIEFFCIALLEVEITEVKDCRCCRAAFSLALISMSKSSSSLEVLDESGYAPDKSLATSCCNNFKALPSLLQMLGCNNLIIFKNNRFISRVKIQKRQKQVIFLQICPLFPIADNSNCASREDVDQWFPIFFAARTPFSGQNILRTPKKFWWNFADIYC